MGLFGRAHQYRRARFRLGRVGAFRWLDCAYKPEMPELMCMAVAMPDRNHPTISC